MIYNLRSIPTLYTLLWLGLNSLAEIGRFNSKNFRLLNEINLIECFSMTKKNDKEIVVRAPSKPVIHPEKKAEKAAEKALEEERFGVLQISHKVGMYFSTSILVSGVLLLCLFTYVTVTGYVDWIIISPEITFLGLVVWIFVSIVNVVGGLLLMGSE